MSNVVSYCLDCGDHFPHKMIDTCESCGSKWVDTDIEHEDIEPEFDEEE